MTKLLYLVLAATMFLAACADPSANKPKATTTESTTNANAANSSNTGTATAPAGKKEELAITDENSKVEFTGSKVTGEHHGGFKKFAGTIELVDSKVESSSVSVDIEVASVFTDADGLTKHLQTGDFFEAEKFPKATFKSTKIVADAAQGPGIYTVTGDLTLRGVTKSVTFPATINVTEADVTVNSEFSINRKDFGILYAGKADDLIRDNVVLKLELRSPRKK